MVSSLAASPRFLEGVGATELYLTVAPPEGDSLPSQAHDLYLAVRDLLAAAGARIFSERVFATEEAMPVVEAERRAALGKLDDAVRPTKVVVSPGMAGPFAGVQVHAISADMLPRPLRGPEVDSPAFGRELRLGRDRWLTVSGMGPSGDGAPGEQARSMFEAVGRFLRQAGADMRSVVRTWLWLRDICDWYGDFNAARTDFFEREGLIRRGDGPPRLPASTGIGLGCASGSACAIDFIAMPGAEDRIEFFEAGGQQESAFAYGSAFSRAAVAPMPGGRTLFVSGTAAIDAQGRTEHVGDAEAQIEATLRHARALLSQVGCGDEHVLGAMVYCKTPQVERAFRSGWTSLIWPAVTMVGDVCRPDLLFEVELIAGPVPDVGTKG